MSRLVKKLMSIVSGSALVFSCSGGNLRVNAMDEMNQKNESTNEFKTLTAYELTECIREYQESFLAGVPSIDEFKKVVEAIGDKQNEVREFLEHKCNSNYAKPLLEVFNSILKYYEAIRKLPKEIKLTWDLILSNVEPKNGLYEKIKSKDDSYINENVNVKELKKKRTKMKSS